MSIEYKDVVSDHPLGAILVTNWPAVSAQP